VDEHFKQSVAGLSGQLGERAAWKTTSDPKAAAEARRAALQAYDLARARRWKTALQAAGAAVAAAGVAGLTIFIAISPDKLSPNVTASVARAPSIGRVAAAPPPAALPPIASAPSVVPAMASEPTPAKPEPAKPVPIKPAAAVEAASVEPAPVPAAEPAPLRRDEVAEVQTRLYSFGFNPGPPDGAVGPMTQAAVMRYLQDRGQPQTATIDRELLEQLRQDPAPPVAAPPQVAQRTARPAQTSSAARRSDPFEPMRVAAQNVERWFQSLGR
jgi:hypothetical protein